MANKLKVNRKKIIFITLAILVVSVAGLAVWWQISQQGLGQGEQGDNANTNKQLSKEDLISKVKELQQANKHEAAKKLIQDNGGYTANPTATRVYAQNLAKASDVNAAVDVLTEAGSGAKDAYWYKGHAANILASQGDLDKAVEYYKEAIALAKQVVPETDEEKTKVITSIADYEWYIDYYAEGN